MDQRDELVHQGEARSVDRHRLSVAACGKLMQVRFDYASSVVWSRQVKLTPEEAERLLQTANALGLSGEHWSKLPALTPEQAERVRQKSNAILRGEVDAEYWLKAPLTRDEEEGVRQAANIIGGQEVDFDRVAERALQLLRSSSKSEVDKHVAAGEGNGAFPLAAKILSPPRGAKFALLMIPKRNREHLIGCLEEEYRTIAIPEYGSFWARMWYWEQAAIAVGCYLWPLLKRVLGMAAIWKVIGR